jgi:NitT/TauT family transport system substrate-binding protein
MAQARWLEANGETAARLARAMRRTLDWARGHRAEELRDKLGRSGPAEELEAFRATIASCSPDGKMPAGGPEAVRNALRIAVPAVSASDVTGTYTDRYVPVD